MRPRVGTILRTLRHLRPRQALHQAAHLLRGAPHPATWRGAPPALAATAPPAAFLGAPAHARAAAGAGRWTLRLLNREVVFGGRIDWDHAGSGPLWAFHLHQFDWARGSGLDAAARGEAVLDWIERHHAGTGWLAGPISLRALAWLKLLATPGALRLCDAERARVRASLAAQLDTLESHLEMRLLANHYLSNLLALVAGGVALEGPGAGRWLRHAPAFLDQLDEQVLSDGGHFERSPMYHALLLENLLDLLNLVRAAPGRAPAALEAALREASARMLGALRVYTHPDGEIALFADSALGVAHPPAALAGYARALSVEARAPARTGVLDATGYARLAAGPWSVLVSLAAPMPAYQPGHAHADALAFELCVGGERVVTDTGVCEYVAGVRRQRARATRSHATLEVGGRDQAELWAAHRVGGRPRVRVESLEPGRRVEATCAGWATLKTLHRRVFEFAGPDLVLVDTLEGRPRPVRLTLPLAPGLEAELAGSRARVALATGGALEIDLPDARWGRESLDYYPEFGRCIERAALVGRAERGGRLVWRFRILGRRRDAG